MLNFFNKLLDNPAKMFQRALILGLIFLGLFLINWFFAPKKTQLTELPFSDGQCLKYETFYQYAEDEIQKVVCFEKKSDGGFFENQDKLRIPYDENGFTDYAKQDIENLKQSQAVVFGKMGFLEENVLNQMNIHSIFYGPANLQVGNLSYDGYPVKEFTKFNDKDVYLVEIRPDIDTFLTKQGPIMKFYSKLKIRFSRLDFYKNKRTSRTSSSVDLIERRFYSRQTGILEGLERQRLIRNKDGQIIGEDPDDDLGKYTMILREK